MTQPRIITRGIDETFDYLDQQLKSGQRIFYTRFGDGDIMILQNMSYKNHDYSDSLRQEMEEAILIGDPGFIKGSFVNFVHPSKKIQKFLYGYPMNAEMNLFLLEKYRPEEDWIFENCNAWPYYALYRQKRFVQFLDEHVRPKKKLLIGGIGPEVAGKLYGTIDEYIKTPMKNAYTSIDEWWPEVLEKVENVELVIPSAGAASKVVNKRLWNMNYPVNSLDIGSIIDAIDAIGTRKWIRLMGHRINNVLLPQHKNKSMPFKIKYAWKEAFYELRYQWKTIQGK